MLLYVFSSCRQASPVGYRPGGKLVARDFTFSDAGDSGGGGAPRAEALGDGGTNERRRIRASLSAPRYDNRNRRLGMTLEIGA